MDRQSTADPVLRTIMREGSSYAKKKMKQKSIGSTVFSNGNQIQLPSYSINELTLGNIIGSGEFCKVQEITGIHVLDNFQSEDKIINPYDWFYDVDESSDTIIQEKKKLESNSLLKKPGEREKYVIKCLKSTTKMKSSHFRRGLLDLTIEAKVLSVVSHPNIVKLHGIGRHNLFQHDFFLILELLDSTLRERLDMWKKPKTRSRSFVRKIISRKSRAAVAPGVTLKDKLSVFRDLASACSYLHSHRIIHRDLKPLNVGFSSNGEVKLFDFGLATELRSDKLTEHGLYHLSGNTGTRRYMAPEIARREPYNESADVYSFAILLWEMLAMRMPYEDYTLDMFQVLVATMEDRPDIDPSWPASLQNILRRCWVRDHKHRMKSCELHDELRSIVDGL